MDDLRFVASVYCEERLADSLVSLTMVLLEEEAQRLTFLPVCNEYLFKNEMDFQFQSHGVLLVVVMACQEGREPHHLCTIRIVETTRIRQCGDA